MHREGGTGEIAGMVPTTPVLGHGSEPMTPVSAVAVAEIRPVTLPTSPSRPL